MHSTESSGCGRAFVVGLARSGTLRTASAVLLGAVLIAYPERAVADESATADSSAQNGIYADLGLGVIGLGYERVLGEKVALNLSAHYYRPWYVSDHVFGFGGEVRAFVFLTEPAPHGPYFSSSFRLDHAQAELDSGETPSGIAWGVRATLGYAFALGSAVNLRAGLGVQSHAANLSAASEDQDFAGAYPTADLMIGVRF